jgi:hypothetical protein
MINVMFGILDFALHKKDKLLWLLNNISFKPSDW